MSYCFVNLSCFSLTMMSFFYYKYLFSCMLIRPESMGSYFAPIFLSSLMYAFSSSISSCSFFYSFCWYSLYFLSNLFCFIFSTLCSFLSSRSFSALSCLSYIFIFISSSFLCFSFSSFICFSLSLSCTFLLCSLCYLLKSFLCCFILAINSSAFLFSSIIAAFYLGLLMSTIR